MNKEINEMIDIFLFLILTFAIVRWAFEGRLELVIPSVVAWRAFILIKASQDIKEVE